MKLFVVDWFTTDGYDETSYGVELFYDAAKAEEWAIEEKAAFKSDEDNKYEDFHYQVYEKEVK